MGKHPLHDKDEKGLKQLHEIGEALQANGKHQILDPLHKGKK